MSYTETLEYLYHLPTFHIAGGEAYKPGFDNIRLLLEAIGNPQDGLRVVHVAGTNGKGSTACLIAAALQQAGYRVGLYTSPHLEDLAERIRVNGKPINHRQVTAFVEQHHDLLGELQPSFFETMTALAFHWFAYKRVDVAVVETGLGGRLDATNIVTPLLSVITPIGLDHQQWLGNTLGQIAAEKAGIIKPSTPVVTSLQEPEAMQVIEQKAAQLQAPLYRTVPSLSASSSLSAASSFHHYPCQLHGVYQTQNMATAQLALYVLSERYGMRGFSEDVLKDAFAHVCDLTGLQGRWQVICDKPLTICDIGHNAHALRHVFAELAETHQQKVREWMCLPFDGSEPKPQPRMRVIFGMMRDKDIEAVLPLMPRQAADYYFTQADTPRALPAEELQQMAGRDGRTFPTPVAALKAALEDAAPLDVLLITGSNYIVAEVLTWWHRYRSHQPSA